MRPRRTRRHALERFIRAQAFKRLLLLVLIGGVSASTFAGESKCFGSTSNGRLEGGVSLPLKGDNFSAYSAVGWGLGRTYVHETVRHILLDAYRSLETTAVGKVFVYGETGLEKGGSFKPHKTHQNGLSVDLMVPLVLEGESVPIPGNAFNRYGYDLEFSDQGKYEEYAIDFDALGELIHQVDIAAKERSVSIVRVIFEVPLQQYLWSTSNGAYLQRNVTFSTKQAWVRHDEHIHIDFGIPCSRL